MPEETQTSPDFNLLRKPLSRFADTLGKYTGQMVKTTKGLTGISKVDKTKLDDTSQDTRQPDVDSDQYPRVSRKSAIDTNLTSIVGTPPDGSEQPLTQNKPKPTMASKAVNRVKDTYKNIVSSQRS